MYVFMVQFEFGTTTFSVVVEANVMLQAVQKAFEKLPRLMQELGLSAADEVINLSAAKLGILER